MGENLRRQSDESQEYQRAAQAERADGKRKRSEQGASGKADR